MYYFDWAATTPVSKAALDEYERISKTYIGNPSSNHTLGFQSREILESYRNRISSLLKVNSNSIYFTSGGTESNGIILNSLLHSFTPGEVITTAIEHPAILEYRKFLISKGWKFTSIKCPNGFLNLNDLQQNLNEKVRLVCIMAVNNVVGTVQNLKEAVVIIRNYSEKIGRKIHIHSDAVQAGGKIEFFPQKIGLDSASFSSHKFNGPRGIGILFNSNNSIQPLSHGGGQEFGLRPGTENLPAIASMTVAFENELSCIKDNYLIVKKYRELVENGLYSYFKLISPSVFSNFPIVPNVLCLSTNGIPSEVFLRVMNDKGFCLSAGSACSSNSKGKAESVLSAMNIDPLDRMSAIRISLSHNNTIEEVNNLIQKMIETKKDLSNGKF